QRQVSPAALVGLALGRARAARVRLRTPRLGRRTARRRAQHGQQLAAKVRQQRGNGAEVHDRVEGEALVRPSKRPGDQDQVSRRRYRQELREALDQAEDDALAVRHPTTSSPPSTPMTLPVIQYASACDRSMMARAT